MKHTKNGIKRMLALCLFSAMLWPLCGQTQSNSAEVMRLIEKANDYWQANNSPKKWAFWDHAAYYTGNMEVYKLTGKAAYYDYSNQWCAIALHECGIQTTVKERCELL